MLTRDRWLEEGLRVLAEDGAPGIRIDRIAARLSLSKGSFHHHFNGAAGYRTALLALWEARALDAIPRITRDTRAAEDLLSDLAEHGSSTLNPRLDPAIRAWSLQDDNARAAQERVDAARFAALEAIWRTIVEDPERARIAALIPHLVVIGASVTQPPVSTRDLQGVFRLLGKLVPAVGA